MNEQRILSVVDITAIATVLVSLVATCALALGKFTPLGSLGIAFVLTAGVTIYLRRARGYRMQTAANGLLIPVLLLLLLASAFRLTPYSWTAGGQDQGVYTNMSRHFQTTGEVSVTDKTREALPTELRVMYDATNYALAGPEARVEDRKEGSLDFPGFARHLIAVKCNSIGDVYGQQAVHRRIQNRSG
ncbi:MAG: hypothetical protein ABJL54_20080 [Halioglobus sp.]